MLPHGSRQNEVERRLHLDHRADELHAQGLDKPADELLDSSQLAEWLAVSVQFVEIGRHRGYGPPFIRISKRRIRYRRGDVLVWLVERTYRATAEYGATRQKAVARTRRASKA